MRKRTKLPPDTGGDTSASLDEPMPVEDCEAKTYAEYLGPGRRLTKHEVKPAPGDGVRDPAAIKAAIERVKAEVGADDQVAAADVEREAVAPVTCLGELVAGPSDEPTVTIAYAENRETDFAA